MSKATLATTAALIAGLGLSVVSYSMNAAPASSGDTPLAGCRKRGFRSAFGRAFGEITRLDCNKI
jgi:hypothetical protein